jgi:large subunit ribosomal protein L15
MTRRHKKKHIKYKGSRLHGRGATKHGRGSGSRKGRGSVKGGRNKLYIMKYEPERMPYHKSRKGFTSQKQKTRTYKTINLRDLHTLGDGKEIDITKHGYTKVLGGGVLDKPLIVKALSFSVQAKEKIEKAGGKALVSGKESGE